MDKMTVVVEAIKQLTLPKDLDSLQRLDIVADLLIVQL
jgi:hypothetical protein